MAAPSTVLACQCCCRFRLPRVLSANPTLQYARCSRALLDHATRLRSQRCLAALQEAVTALRAITFDVGRREVG